MKQNKWKIGVAAAIFILLMVGVHFNYNLYDDTIATVVSVSEKKEKEESVYQYSNENDVKDSITLQNGKTLHKKKESYYRQTLVLKIRNGEYKGKVMTTDNVYSQTGLENEKYSKGDDLFVKVNEGSEVVGISGQKRDEYVVFLTFVLFALLLAVAGKQGLLTIVTVIINIAVFVVGILLYKEGHSFGSMTFAMILVFSVVTLVVLNGFHKKTLGAVISSLLTLGFVFLMYCVIARFTEEPPYDLMDYIVGPDELSAIFVGGIMIGCLGAIMDVAITINAAVFELARVGKEVRVKSMIASVREIGYDIMGTMINVLLFTYICGEIPMLIVKIRNGYTLLNLLRFNMIFELYRFTIGSVAIILAIPVSSAVAIFLALYKRKEVGK